MTDLPALWALDEAAKRAGLLDWETVEANHRYNFVSNSIIAHARTIERHEKPPVSRELLCAREDLARIYEARCMEGAAASIRAGKWDDNYTVQERLRAIQLYASGYGEEQS